MTDICPAPHRPVARLTALVVGVVVVLVGLLTACGSGSPSDSATSSTVSLPSDFPRSDVPVLDGPLLSAGGSAADGWDVTVQRPATAATGLDDAVARLTSAGFAEQQRTSEGGGRVVVLTATRSGTRYTVVVGSLVGSAGGPNSVFYQVSRG